MCCEVINLLQKEHKTAPLLASVYYDAFQICICHGEVSRATTFALLASKAKRMWQGDGAPDLEEMEGLARNPGSHQLAFHTKKWFSGKKNTADKPLEATDEWLWCRAG